MQKRVFIVHGWDGYPEEGWFPWLKQQLVDKGFAVEVLQMPSPALPKIDEWVSTLAMAVGDCDRDTYFVGHSLGCQAILRYFQTLPSSVVAGGALFVAGFETLSIHYQEDPTAYEALKVWVETPIDWGKSACHSKKFVAIFSDNDGWVPLSNEKVFSEKLGAKTFVLQSRGHFSGSNRTFELPEALTELLVMTN